MSLTISLRIPDGIVLAADSLATQTSNVQMMADIKAKCPNCNEDIPLEKIQLPPVPVTSSTRSFAQKITSLKTEDGKYSLGIATFGMGLLNERTIYYHIRMLNQDQRFKDVEHASEWIGNYFHDQLKSHIIDISDAPDTFYPLGFQITGYHDNAPISYLVHIGKNIDIKKQDKMGCTYGGQGYLITKMWELNKSISHLNIIWASLSLQDAVDLAEFYINATTNFMRFSNSIPNVGGDVDIALITKYNGFKWIKCKELTKILEADKE